MCSLILSLSRRYNTFKGKDVVLASVILSEPPLNFRKNIITLNVISDAISDQAVENLRDA